MRAPGGGLGADERKDLEIRELDLRQWLGGLLFYLWISPSNNSFIKLTTSGSGTVKSASFSK